MEIEKFFACVAVHALRELMDPDNIPRRVSAQRHEEEFDIAVHGKLVLCNYHWVTRPRGFGFPSNGDLVAIGDCQMHLRWSIDSSAGGQEASDHRAGFPGSRYGAVARGTHGDLRAWHKSSGAGIRAIVELMKIGEDSLAAEYLRLYIVELEASLNVNRHMCSWSARPERHGSAARERMDPEIVKMIRQWTSRSSWLW